ncbi:hypothetical protein BLGI_2237 [Brevibacillus laterosporus GI-9]|nr:hypothetical protein BLGI_2237 [Brevibacillus laterosporus GI-9]
MATVQNIKKIALHLARVAKVENDHFVQQDNQILLKVN